MRIFLQITVLFYNLLAMLLSLRANMCTALFVKFRDVYIYILYRYITIIRQLQSDSFSKASRRRCYTTALVSAN